MLNINNIFNKFFCLFSYKCIRVLYCYCTHTTRVALSIWNLKELGIPFLPCYILTPLYVSKRRRTYVSTVFLLWDYSRREKKFSFFSEKGTGGNIYTYHIIYFLNFVNLVLELIKITIWIIIIGFAINFTTTKRCFFKQLTVSFGIVKVNRWTYFILVYNIL